MRYSFVISLSLYLSFSYAQVCEDIFCDAEVIREVLDLNGLNDLPVDSVAYAEGGRIIALHLLSRNIDTLPDKITQLNELKSLIIITSNISSLPTNIDNISLSGLYSVTSNGDS